MKAISGTPRRLIAGTMVRISSVSPEFDSASTASSRVIMPTSPWLASPGCMKNAGVPVLARVAAILPPMCPDLPMPGDDDAPAAVKTNPAGACKLVSQAGQLRAQTVDLDGQRLDARAR